ncbi:MAG TPA: hypothetical protein VIE42_05655 [Steroidobacteraceae bacterium]|jgi:hypothetical protein
MKYFSTAFAATAALGLGSFAWGAGPDDQTAQAAQPPPPAQAMPQAEQSMPQEGQAPVSPGTHLAALVPAGMTTGEACTGFKSVKDCAASLHASQNLNIPFGDLKAKVTGGQGLGAAIHELKPDANARAEVKRAEGQAREDVHASRG